MEALTRFQYPLHRADVGTTPTVIDMECTVCFALVPYDGVESLLVVRKGVIVTEDVFRL